MNIENIKKLSYKKICMNPIDYYDLFNDTNCLCSDDELYNVLKVRDRNNKRCKLGNVYVYTDFLMRQGCIKVSNSLGSTNTWSKKIPIEFIGNVDKFLKLQSIYI